MPRVYVIVAAAIKDLATGRVYVGARHNNVIHDMVQMHGYKPPVDRKHHVQGFITNKHEFVDRVQAAKIAFEANQTSVLLRELMSEDIY